MNPTGLMLVVLIIGVSIQASRQTMGPCPNNCQCSATSTVNCKGSNFTLDDYVPQYNDYELRWRNTLLTIKETQISDLNGTLLAASIVYLIISGNPKLTQIRTAGFFVHQCLLQNLDLRNNSLATIGPDVFTEQCTTMLKTIELDNNRLTTLPPGLFAKLTDLRYLSLTGNQISGYGICALMAVKERLASASPASHSFVYKAGLNLDPVIKNELENISSCCGLSTATATCVVSAGTLTATCAQRNCTLSSKTTVTAAPTSMATTQPTTAAASSTRSIPPGNPTSASRPTTAKQSTSSAPASSTQTITAGTTPPKPLTTSTPLTSCPAYCHCGTNTVTCTGKNFTIAEFSVPFFNYSNRINVNMLTISGTTITNLDQIIYPKASLVQLIISGNQKLTNITHFWDHDCSLQHLVLTNNSLTTLAPGLFSRTKDCSAGVDLLTIELDNNKLTTLSPGLFTNLPKLHYLSLVGNQISGYDTCSLVTVQAMLLSATSPGHSLVNKTGLNIDPNTRAGLENITSCCDASNITCLVYGSMVYPSCTGGSWSWSCAPFPPTTATATTPATVRTSPTTKSASQPTSSSAPKPTVSGTATSVVSPTSILLSSTIETSETATPSDSDSLTSSTTSSESDSATAMPSSSPQTPQSLAPTVMTTASSPASNSVSTKAAITPSTSTPTVLATSVSSPTSQQYTTSGTTSALTPTPQSASTTAATSSNSPISSSTSTSAATSATTSVSQSTTTTAATSSNSATVKPSPATVATSSQNFLTVKSASPSVMRSGSRANHGSGGVTTQAATTGPARNETSLGSNAPDASRWIFISVAGAGLLIGVTLAAVIFRYHSSRKASKWAKAGLFIPASVKDTVSVDAASSYYSGVAAVASRGEGWPANMQLDGTASENPYVDPDMFESWSNHPAENEAAKEGNVPDLHDYSKMGNKYASLDCDPTPDMSPFYKAVSKGLPTASPGSSFSMVDPEQNSDRTSVDTSLSKCSTTVDASYSRVLSDRRRSWQPQPHQGSDDIEYESTAKYRNSLDSIPQPFYATSNGSPTKSLEAGEAYPSNRCLSAKSTFLPMDGTDLAVTAKVYNIIEERIYDNSRSPMPNTAQKRQKVFATPGSILPQHSATLQTTKVYDMAGVSYDCTGYARTVALSPEHSRSAKPVSIFKDHTTAVETANVYSLDYESEYGRAVMTFAKGESLKCDFIDNAVQSAVKVPQNPNADE